MRKINPQFSFTEHARSPKLTAALRDVPHAAIDRHPVMRELVRFFQKRGIPVTPPEVPVNEGQTRECLVSFNTFVS